MDDCCLITAITGIACAITKYCSDDDISLLSVALSQLGDTLATYLTQKEIRENRISNISNKKSSENEISAKIKTSKDTDTNNDRDLENSKEKDEDP